MLKPQSEGHLSDRKPYRGFAVGLHGEPLMRAHDHEALDAVRPLDIFPHLWLRRVQTFGDDKLHISHMESTHSWRVLNWTFVLCVGNRAMARGVLTLFL